MNKKRWIALMVWTALAVGVTAYVAQPHSETPGQGVAPLVAIAVAGKAGPPSRDDLLRTAFGADAVETRRPIRWLIRDKGLILAAERFAVEEDGRVKMTEVSA